jgi:hypothetical protein
MELPLDLSSDFVIHVLCSHWDESVLLCIKNAGCEGTGMLMESLLSMRTIEAIVGLTATFS